MVGVVAHVRTESLETDPLPQVYWSYHQWTQGRMVMAVRTIVDYAESKGLTDRVEILGFVDHHRSVDWAKSVGATVINLSLAVFNLLPIPGLDGGRMLLSTIVALRGRPFKPGQEEQFHFFGVMAVLALIVLITFRELSALYTG